MSISATPPQRRSAWTVTAQVELVAVEGRKLRFKVECRDDKDVIGAGFHERTIIDQAKFLARLAAKAGEGR